MDDDSFQFNILTSGCACMGQNMTTNRLKAQNCNNSRVRVSLDWKNWYLLLKEI